MAFVVEDGTGRSDATSFCSVEFADSYFTDRGNSTWAVAQLADKQSSLINATDYINRVFGRAFVGSKALTTQRLSWPRIDLPTIDLFNAVPIDVQMACCEYAVRALSKPLAPDPTISDSGAIVVKTKESIGPIAEESQIVTKGIGSEPMLIRPYPMADLLLSDLIVKRSTVIR